MIVAACVVLLIAAYLGFKLLKSLVKGFLLGLGLAAGVTLAWKIGLLPRETPTVVEKTGRKVEHKVQDMTTTVTRGAKEAAQEVNQAIGELPTAQREATKLKYHEGRSNQSIAIILEKSTQAVEGLLKRAKKQLFGLLGGGEDQKKD